MARRARARRRGRTRHASGSRLISGVATTSASLAAARRRAHLVLRVEALLPALAPSAAVAGSWVAAALLGLLALLPPLLGAPVTAAALLAAAALGVRRVSALRPPAAAAVDRRLELASRLSHRPLAALADHRATGAASVWEAHQARLAGQLGGLRAGPPRVRLAPADRYGLRFIVPAAVVAGLLVARDDAGALLLAAAAPGIAPVPGPAGNLQAWISPPAFTGLAPVFLHAGVGETARVPEGSVLTASLTGSEAEPRLRGGSGGRSPHFASLGDGSYQVAEPLTRSGAIRIRQGGHLVASWRVEIVPLGVPAVSWAGSPDAWRGGWRTSLPWRVSYPYGVASLRAELVPVGVPGAAPITVAIPLDGEPHDAHGTEIPDLSASPFAGTAVDATLIARDGRGTTGRSDTRRFTLPARPFHNPLARAVLDARRRLALHPDGHGAVADDLATLGRVPRAFDRAGSSGTYLNLVAVAALVRDRGDAAAVAEAEDRLWELALLLEDASHEGAQAARSALAMRSARDALDQQLERMRELGPRGQTPQAQAELGRRVEALKRALAQRLRDLLQQALKGGTVMPPGPTQAGDPLQQMMKRLDDAARAGRPEDAARALSSMEDMLDRARAATPDEVKQALASMAANQQAAKQMQALGDMVKREGELLDQTAKRAGAASGDSAPPPLPSPNGDPDAAAGAPPPRSPAAMAPPPAAADARAGERRIQHALGRAADALASQFQALTGKKPAALGQAHDAMSAAEAALGRGDDAAASGAERQALADLQSGGQQMSKQMQSRGKNGSGALALLPGFSPGGDGGTSGDAADTGRDDSGGAPDTAPRDPLGRRLTGNGRANGDDTELALPDDSSRARNREIEEELRRRDSNRERPADELRYLDRLLQAF